MKGRPFPMFLTISKPLPNSGGDKIGFGSYIMREIGIKGKEGV